MAHLMKFHLLHWEVVKVKFLMNSNRTLKVLNLHQKTDPKVLPTHLPTPYSFRDIARTIFIGQGHYGKVKGQIKVRP